MNRLPLWTVLSIALAILVWNFSFYEVQGADVRRERDVAVAAPGDHDLEGAAPSGGLVPGGELEVPPETVGSIWRQAVWRAADIASVEIGRASCRERV